MHGLLLRVGNLFMAGFFFLASYVQQNDPDAALWIVAYVVPAFLCLAYSIKPNVSGNFIWRCMSIIHLVLCACGEAYTLYRMYNIGPMSRGHTQQWYEREEAREFGGLLIVSSWLSLCILQTKSSSRDSGPSLFVILSAVLLVTTPFILWTAMSLKKDYVEIQPNHCKGSLRMPSYSE